MGLGGLFRWSRADQPTRSFECATVVGARHVQGHFAADVLNHNLALVPWEPLAQSYFNGGLAGCPGTGVLAPLAPKGSSNELPLLFYSVPARGLLTELDSFQSPSRYEVSPPAGREPVA
jgi:hypothetical protein